MAAAARILELNAQATAKKKDLETLLVASQTEKRPLNPEEITASAKIQADLEAIAATIKAEQTAGQPAPVFTGGALVAEGDKAHRGFNSPQEMLLAVVANAGARDRSEVSDDRLKPLAVTDDGDKNRGAGLAFMLPAGYGPKAAVGSDEHGEYDNRYGGFSVRPGYGPDRPLIGFDGDPTDGLCEVVPMSAPLVKLDATVDKSHSTSVAGGLTVSRRAEASAMTSSRQEMEQIEFKASATYGLAYATEELLEDSPVSFVARITNGFGLAFRAFKFNEKLRGKGGNERLGILTALAASSLGPTISIAKETGQAADTFLADNVLKMRARAWGYGSCIWIANPDCYPQLSKMSIAVGVGGQLVYQNSIAADRPDMLLGRPIIYNEYASTVGDQGDLILGNWSQYGEGEYRPLQSAESIHVRFTNHERTMKFWKRDCGQPFWKSALTPAKSSSTLSPFVVLDAR